MPRFFRSSLIGIHNNANAQRSLDDGVTWSGGIHAVVVARDYTSLDENQHYHVWLGTLADRRLFRSLDGGVTWAAIGVDAHNARTLKSIVRTPSGRFIVGLSRAVAPDNTVAIAYTDNEGATWTVVQVNAGDADCRECALWASLDVPGLVFVAAAQNPVQRLFRSTDNGVTWEQVFDGQSIGLFHFVDNVFIDPITGHFLMLVVGSANSRVYRSLAASQGAAGTWTEQVNIALALSDGNMPRRSRFVRTDLGRVFCTRRLFSDNGGGTWTDTGFGTSATGGAMCRSVGALFHAPTDVAVYQRSVNHGVTWVDMAFPAGEMESWWTAPPELAVGRSKAKKMGGSGSGIGLPFVRPLARLPNR